MVNLETIAHRLKLEKSMFKTCNNPQPVQTRQKAQDLCHNFDHYLKQFIFKRTLKINGVINCDEIFTK